MNKEREKFVRNLIRDMLMYILKEIPNNDDEIKNTRAREEFTSLFTSLPYKAPEILLGYYDKIRKILTTTIPIDPDDSKNPPWKKNIVQKWTESCIELDEKLLPKVKQAKIP